MDLLDRIRSPLARKLLTVLAVLVAANVVLAVLGPGLPDPVRYPTREIQLSVEQLDEQTADGCADLLVTGNSIAAHDLSASTLATAMGLRSGIVSVLPGSIATVDVDWMDRVTLPRADPGTIVYVISPLTFAPPEVAERYGLGIYTRSVATRGGWAGDLHRWAVDHSPLFEYRLSVADVEAVVDDVEGDLPIDYEEILAETGRTVDADGHIRARGSFAGSQAFLDRLADAARQVSDVWRVDPDQVEALRERFDDLVAEGREVAVVIPPVASSLPPVFPGGPEGYDAYLEAARTFGAGAGFSTVDLSGPGYADDLFWDTHHLNEQGAQQFTAQVAAALDGIDPVACSDDG